MRLYQAILRHSVFIFYYYLFIVFILFVYSLIIRLVTPSVITKSMDCHYSETNVPFLRNFSGSSNLTLSTRVLLTINILSLLYDNINVFIFLNVNSFSRVQSPVSPTGPVGPLLAPCSVLVNIRYSRPHLLTLYPGPAFLARAGEGLLLIIH